MSTETSGAASDGADGGDKPKAAPAAAPVSPVERLDKAKGAGEAVTGVASAIQAAFGTPIIAAAQNVAKLASDLNSLQSSIQGQTPALQEARNKTIELATSLGVYDAQTGKLKASAAEQVGAVVRMNEAWEALKNKLTFVGTQFAAALAPQIESVVGVLGRVVGWISQGVQWFNGLDATTKKIVLTVGVFAGGLLLLLAAVAPLVAGVMGLVAVLGGPVLGVVAAVAAVVMALVTAFLVWGDEIRNGAAAAADYLTERWNAFLEFASGLGARAIAIGTEIKDGFLSTLSALGEFFGTTIPGYFEDFLGWVGEWGGRLGTAIGGAVDQALAFLRGLPEYLQTALPQAFNAFVDSLKGWGESLGGMVSGAVDRVMGTLGRIGDYLLNELPQRILGGAPGIVDALIEGLLNAARKIPGVGDEIAGYLADFLQGHSPPKKGPLSKIIEGAGNVVDAWVGGLMGKKRAVEGAAGALALAADGSFGKAGKLAPGATAVALAGSSAAVATTMSGTTPGAGSTASPLVSGAAGAGAGEEGEKSGLGKLFADLKGSVTGVIGQFHPLAIVAELIGEIFKGIQPVLDALKEPLRLVGQIFGQALAPVLEAMFPIFKLLAIATTWVGEFLFRLAAVLLKVSAAIWTGIGTFIAGIGKLINKLLPGNPAKGLVKLGEGMVKTGKTMNRVADGFEKGADALKKGRKQIEDMEWGETAEAARDLSESLQNVPDGFRVALARLEAMTPEPVGGGSGPGGGEEDPVIPTRPPHTGPGRYPGDEQQLYSQSSGGAAPVTIQQVQIVSNDPEAIWREMRRIIERENARGYGSPLSPVPA